MIYCVWYPSGGFGHFVNAILSLYGDNFVRPKGVLSFSSVGDSHSIDLVVPKYYMNRFDHFTFDFNSSKNYSIAIDNGINDENDNFRSRFPSSVIIKMCYNDLSWPIIARTMIDKAMRSTVDSELTTTEWSTTDDWAKREKYFLYLRDHHLRNAWKPEPNTRSIDISQLMDYNVFFQQLNNITTVSNFDQVWQTWNHANQAYLSPIRVANSVINAIQNRNAIGLRNITNIWDQAVIYYFMWVKFGIEIPHNDFADWIDSSDQLANLI